MADIKLVIKIPEEIRLALINNIPLSITQQSICVSYIEQAIINGTPLPKGHGRLIDADALKYKQTHHGNYCTPFELIDKNGLNNAPTIIEAESEVENGNDD